jgi:hypothetical protein
MRALGVTLAVVTTLAGVCHAPAQIDPFKRELVQLGYNLPLQGRGPLAGYAFYFVNKPDFPRTNLTLRAAVAPVYLDSELGIRRALGPHTDLGVGLAGGGFADSYSEMRRGVFLREESFTGHGVSGSVTVYHLFNAGRRIPLHGVVRGEVGYQTYERDDETAPGFVLPEPRTEFQVRSGLRWGGREPTITPAVGLELSAWYEGQFRTDAGAYGFGGDRRVEQDAHLFWARALLAYTLPELKHNFFVSVTAGTSVDPDRFSAYRLGGFLPLASEFPLSLPGYFYQEISARQFVLFGGNYTVPLSGSGRWALIGGASVANVEYLRGLEQPDAWNSGAALGLSYRSPSQNWQVYVGYAYGFQAIRDNGRGAHSIGFLVQFDLGRARAAGLFEPGTHPDRSRGLLRIFDIFR